MRRSQKRHGQVNLRHGNRNRVIGNTLEDMLSINVRGDDHQVLGNRIVTRKSSGKIACIRVCKGNVYNSAGSWQSGYSGQGRHPAARRCVVADNVIGRDLEIGISGGTGSSPGGPLNKAAEGTIYQDNVIRGNNGEPEFGLAKGTKKSGFKGSVPKAVELTKAEVGIGAPDPRQVVISQTLQDGDRIGPGEFEWLATISPEDKDATVVFLIDGKEVNREGSAPYGDRRNNHEDFLNWRDTTRYKPGRHEMTVRIESSGIENTVTVDMVAVQTHSKDPISQTLRDGDRIGPGEFEWRAALNPEDEDATVVFLIDGKEVNREGSAPYGDRRNDHVDFFYWRDTRRFGAGRHRMTVRKAGSDLEHTVTVNMVESGDDPTR